MQVRSLSALPFFAIVLLGEGIAFQAVEVGSNPSGRSKFSNESRSLAW
jgi:hypothetical protein